MEEPRHKKIMNAVGFVFVLLLAVLLISLYYYYFSYNQKNSQPRQDNFIDSSDPPSRVEEGIDSTGANYNLTNPGGTPKTTTDSASPSTSSDNTADTNYPAGTDQDGITDYQNISGGNFDR